MAGRGPNPVRFKLVPPAPDSLAALDDAQRAVSLVPVGEAEAVASLERRLELPSRDVARTWLTFLRAVGLVERVAAGEGTDGTFRRTGATVSPESLRTALVDSVFGAREVLSELHDRADDGPVGFEALFAPVATAVPEWERNKNPRTWEDVWRDRVDHLLSWLVLADAIRTVPDGYLPDASVDVDT